MKKSMPWFRFYAEALSDPKVQRLPGDLFKTWMNLLCLATQNGGVLPSMDDIEFHLRMSPRHAQQHVDELILAGLIDIMPDGSRQPHNWHVRQYSSDTSTERVRKHREKRACNVSRNGDRNVAGSVAATANETPPDTEAESETETAPLPPPIDDDEPEPKAGSGQARKIDLGGLVLGAALDRVTPETLRTAARELAIADASPLLPAFERWPKSQSARDRNALFLATAPTLFERAKPAIRAACQPLAELVDAGRPTGAATPRCSPELAARLRGGKP